MPEELVLWVLAVPNVGQLQQRRLRWYVHVIRANKNSIAKIGVNFEVEQNDAIDQDEATPLLTRQTLKEKKTQNIVNYKHIVPYKICNR